MRKRQILKDVTRALSLANLCFIKTWSVLLGGATDPRAKFDVYSSAGTIAIILNVLFLATLFWGAMTIVRFSGNTKALSFARSFFLLLLIVVINGLIETHFPTLSPARTFEPLSGTELILLGIMVAVLLVCAIKRWQRFMIWPAAIIPFILVGRIDWVTMTVLLGIIASIVVMCWHRITIAAAANLVLLLFPFAVMTLVQAAWLIPKYCPNSPAPAMDAKRTSTKRIFWLIFDEMDYRLSFSQRPTTLLLPELDLFKSQAIQATNAYPPADYTLMAIPALITGKLVSKAQPVDPSEIMLTFADSTDPVPWSTQPNFFSKARDEGFNSALIGWYHPYCETIGASLAACSESYSVSRSVSENMISQIRDLIHTVPLASHHGILNDLQCERRKRRQWHLRDYLSILEEAKRAVVNPKQEIVLVHWPIPHLPGIYNRFDQAFELDAESSYLDNLKLVDRTLGELRKAMESAGTWDSTTILLTSDHWWRAESWRAQRFSARLLWTNEDEAIFSEVLTTPDHRVPFLLKLAGQNECLTYDPEFNTVLTQDLFLTLLRGEVSDLDGVSRWLDQHRSIGESPYIYEEAK